MKYFFLITTLIFQTIAFGRTGGERGNGGFLYSRTSKVLLDEAQKTLMTDLASLLMKREAKIYFTSGCRKQIDLNDLNELVSNLDYNYEDHTSTENVDGVLEPRYFQFNENNRIEATDIFFSSFVDTYYRYIDAKNAKNEDAQEKILTPIRIALIHEALHYFGYNEYEARSCGNEVHYLIEKYNDNKFEKILKSSREQNYQNLYKQVINTKCLSEVQFMKIQSERERNSVEEAFFQTAEYRLLRCIEKRIASFEKENSKKSETEFRYGLRQIFSNGKSLYDVVVYLVDELKFNFEVTPVRN